MGILIIFAILHIFHERRRCIAQSEAVPVDHLAPEPAFWLFARPYKQRCF